MTYPIILSNINVQCNIFPNKIQVKLHTTTLICTFMPYNMFTKAGEIQSGHYILTVTLIIWEHQL